MLVTILWEYSTACQTENIMENMYEATNGRLLVLQCSLYYEIFCVKIGGFGVIYGKISPLLNNFQFGGEFGDASHNATYTLRI